MIVKIWINQNQDNNGRCWFEAECDAIPLVTNVEELQGELVMFYGESRSSVIQQIVEKLQSRGLAGTLKIQ